LVALLNQMKASIKKFDDAIEEISQQHPWWTIASLPGRRSGYDRSAVSRPGERSPLRNCVSDAMRHRDRTGPNGEWTNQDSPVPQSLSQVSSTDVS
jgi:hypothetical protein